MSNKFKPNNTDPAVEFKLKDYTTMIVGRWSPKHNCFYVQKGSGDYWTYGSWGVEFLKVFHLNITLKGWDAQRYINFIGVAVKDGNSDFLPLEYQPRTMNELFEKRPGTWGLRGDPAMWYMLKEYSGTTAVPKTKEDLLYFLEEAFSYTQSCPPDNKEELMKKHSGMSQGTICEEFWREKGFNFIVKNYESLKLKFPNAFKYKNALS